MTTSTTRERLRYRFDNFMSRGTAALIGGLALLSLVVILLAALVIWLGNIRPDGVTDRLGFVEAAWESMMRTLDPGTMGGDTGWGFRLVMFIVTLGGIFVISTLIGVLSSGIESKTDELRKGRSKVIEAGHTVILGWSPQIFSVISELIVANENQKNACIVVLADLDKVVMQDQIREKAGRAGQTRIVCRTGSPIETSDLDLVSLQTSKSIVILSPESQFPDADVIKTAIAVLRAPDRRPEPYHVVAELRRPENREVVHLIGKDEVELVLVGDLIARIIAQTCLQSGLSVVYTGLLDFAGDEIYFAREPALVGKTFGEVLLAYEDSSVIGLMTNDNRLELNPPMDTLIQSGDQVIAVSRDDDTIRLSGKTELGIDETAIRSLSRPSREQSNILILGWNSDAAPILQEIDYYVSVGSQVTVVADRENVEARVLGCCPGLRNLRVSFVRGDFSNRSTLEGLGLGGYQRILLLSCSDDLDPQRADALTLVTLLHLRDLADRQDYQYAIVSQILDVRNRALAEVSRADDFIVSDKLASLMVSQVSENKYLNAVFADLFDPEGSEIYLKPAGEFVDLERPVNFYTVVESARRRGEVAIGYRLKSKSRDAGQGYGVVVNPPKSALIDFQEQDRIIVLAEE